MKTYKFEVTLTEEMLEGDEFWENVIKEDNTGITPLLGIICDSISETFSIADNGYNVSDYVTLKEFKDQ